MLISWEWLHFGASDLQICEDDFAWQVQHFVWPGLAFSWQAQYFRQVEWKNQKTHWYEAVSSALNCPLLKEITQNCFVFLVVNFENRGSLADLFRFEVVNFKNWGSLAELLCFWCCQLQLQLPLHYSTTTTTKYKIQHTTYYNILQYTTRYYNIVHYITLHYTTRDDTTRLDTTRHDPTLHYTNNIQ